MKIIFYGGRQAGISVMLALLAMGHKILCVVPVDEPVASVAAAFGLDVRKPKNINDPEFVAHAKSLGADLFVCCHGRQIIKKELLESFPCMNFHPCLYQYKGADPIGRMLADRNTKASVAAHWMVEAVDAGDVIVENFQEVKGTTPLEVYNELYPLYIKTAIDAMAIVAKEKNLR